MPSLPARASSSASTGALSVPTVLASHIGCMATKQEGRPLAVVGSGRPFRGMIGAASGFRIDASPADFLICVGVNLNQERSHFGLACELAIELPHAAGCGLLLGNGLAVNFDVVEGAKCAGHGWSVVWWREFVSHASNVTRGGRHGKHWPSQFTICHPPPNALSAAWRVRVN